MLEEAEPCRAKRMKCFWACEATWVGERLSLFFCFFDVVGEKVSGAPYRGRMEAKTLFPASLASPLSDTHVTTNVREISFHFPLPSAARPWMKARCSSALQGDPLEFGVAAAVAVCNGFVAATVACIGAPQPCCAASRAGVILLDGLRRVFARARGSLRARGAFGTRRAGG